MVQSRQIRLASRPVGLPGPEAFSLSTAEIPAPAAGELHIRNRWLSVDPAIRGRMYDAPSYVPPFAPGDLIASPAVGEVVHSNDPAFAPGDKVLHEGGWSEWINLPAAEVTRIPDLGLPEQAFLGIAGITGLTAWVGLTRMAPLAHGDVVLVSAAAGAVGSVVCLIAKMLGHRVIGIAGGPAKTQWLLDELKVDAAIDYRGSKKLRTAITESAPDGIDVYFDNVGGPMLEAAISCARPFARFAMCGSISGYNAVDPVPGPRNMTLVPVKRINMRGYIVLDHVELMPEWHRQLAEWNDAGKLSWRETVIEGIENAGNAFTGLFRGENLGKMLVHLP